MVNSQAAKSRAVKGQAQLWVKGQAQLWVKGQNMPTVHPCTQLYAARCLWAGLVGVARFIKISGGGVCGRGQVLVKSQGQNLA